MQAPRSLPSAKVTAEIGVLGGSGFYRFLDDITEVTVETPFGPPSDRIAVGEVGGRAVAFLPRHGRDHSVPPHAINYRANLWALAHLGVTRVVGPVACGSLKADVARGDIVVCDQLVDRTSGRRDTFYDGPRALHVSFADPFCPELRALTLAAAANAGAPQDAGSTRDAGSTQAAAHTGAAGTPEAAGDAGDTGNTGAAPRAGDPGAGEDARDAANAGARPDAGDPGARGGVGDTGAEGGTKNAGNTGAWADAEDAADSVIRAHDGGTIVVIQGPRFSTRAESAFYARQGWDVINMTAYPEAVLARELELCYVNVSLVTDYDVGIEGVPAVTAETVVAILKANNKRMQRLLLDLIPRIPTERKCPCATALAGAGLD